MTETFTFSARADDAPFALGAEPRSWRDLWADAGKIAAGLDEWGGAERGEAPTPVELLLATRDRYFAAAALLALWSRGLAAALPLHARGEGLATLTLTQGLGGVLHDGRPSGEEAADGSDDAAESSPFLVDALGASRVRDLRAFLSRSAPPLPSFALASSRKLVTVYTSGSTGAPVACPKTAGQLLGEARLLVEHFRLGPTTRLVATVPAQHIYGLLFSVLVPLVGGGALVRETPHHAETIATLARRHATNVLCSVPVHLQGLSALPATELPRFGLVFSSGAPLPEALALSFAHAQEQPVREIFGSSETGGIAWRARVANAEGVAASDPAWTPFPGLTVAAADDESLLLRSPFAPMPADGSPYVSADRVRLLPDGRFLLLGRRDGVLKIGGSRVSVGEVEQLLKAIPGVRDAAVLAVEVPSSRGHELWAALVAPGLTPSEVRRALARQLEAVAIPRRFRFVETLPREATGKLTHARLRALFEDRVRPRGPARLTAPSGDGDEQTALRRFSFPDGAPAFAGHFPGFPLVPGVVQLNDLVLKSAREAWPHLGTLTQVTGLKFRSPIRPGDEVAVALRLASATKVTFELRRGPEILSSGALAFRAELARR